MQKRKLQTVILDDDLSIVRLLRVVLEKHFSDELDISQYTDPLEAQAGLDATCCDLLISDIDMPGKNGIEMLDYAKKRNAWTQVVFLTGQSSWVYVTDAVEHGASDFLLKPIDTQSLCSVVEQLIERTRRWQVALFPKPSPAVS